MNIIIHSGFNGLYGIVDCLKALRGQLFTINVIVSLCFVKILNANITNTLLFFVDKM